MYQKKLQQEGVQDVVKQIKFEPYGDLFDQAFSQIKDYLINNQDLHSQIENDETPGAEYPNEGVSEEGETKILHFPTSDRKYYHIMKSQNVHIP